MKMIVGVVFGIVFGLLTYRETGLFTAISIFWFWCALGVLDYLRDGDKNKIVKLSERLNKLDKLDTK